jgi:hypothetical protein
MRMKAHQEKSPSRSVIRKLQNFPSLGSEELSFETGEVLEQEHTPSVVPSHLVHSSSHASRKVRSELVSSGS